MRRLVALLAVLLLLPASFASARSADTAAPRFTIEGRVLDPLKAPIAGARVTAVADGQAQSVGTMSDARGDFSLSLPTGAYTLTVQADGFTVAAQHIAPPDSGSVSLNFVLEIAGFRDQVTVNAPEGYQVPVVTTATKTPTMLRDVPQSVTVVTKTLVQDQLMMSIGDVVRYVPGMAQHQGENNRDQVIIRGNNSSADFYVNGVRDDVQYYRDLYNLERVEALKGPNAMVFGRGGGGGVVNRVTKEAGFQPVNEVTLQAGGYGNKRVTGDVDRAVSDTVAVRLNGVYENSDSFRNSVNLERYGVSPTATVMPSDRTRITFGYEYLHDGRVADRGITSYQNRPAGVPIETYYGNPDNSFVRADVNLASAMVEHRIGAATLRNRTLFGAYDRGYQNYVPGGASSDGTMVALSAYNNATNRQNLFNQTDLTWVGSTGRLRHTVLLGAEAGWQWTDNFRNTGYFNDTATSILVPFDTPTISTPITFRQSATDADNHVGTGVAAAYVQDQVEISRHVQLVGGVRFDRFDLTYHNNRNDDAIGRTDNFVSPRAGIVYKPIVPLSIYGSYTVSYLPSSGDQFSSLTTITEQLKPESFDNYEVGAKWDVRPDFSLTTAVYRLDRTNTRSIDPNDPTRIVQTGSQRTNGYELGLNGRLTQAWNIAGGYTFQDATVTSATATAKQGATVAQVPHHTASVWNNYQFLPRVAAGLGLIYRSDMFAAIDNTVVLPGYFRADAAAFITLNRELRLQVNVENLANTKYYLNADNNTNISPGFPRAVRVALVARF
jgi:catecholate siderophore receptor